MERSVKHGKPVVTGRVFDGTGAGGPVRGAEVRLLAPTAETAAGREAAKDKEGSEKAQTAREKAAGKAYIEIDRAQTDDEGNFRFSRGLEEGVAYHVRATAFGIASRDVEVTIEPGCEACVSLPLNLNLMIHTVTCPAEGEQPEHCERGKVGRSIIARVESTDAEINRQIAGARWDVSRGADITEMEDNEVHVRFGRSGRVPLEAWVRDKNPNSFGDHAHAFVRRDYPVADPDIDIIGGKVGVALERTAVPPTLDQALWVAIRNRTRAISFGPYNDFIERVMAAEEREVASHPRLERQLRETIHGHGVGAYQLLKTATEVFLLLECGVRIRNGRYEHHRLFNREEESGRLGEFVTLDFVNSKLREYLGTRPQLPYITRIIEASFPQYLHGGLFCDRVVSTKLNEPCLIELIWSYWHEEGMLAQTMNAINRRFQNVRAPGERDPLLHLELDPLRRMGNLLWGLIQDELHTLSVKRRAYEYAHHYGLSIYGRAAATNRPADNRSKFLEAFHNLLHLASVFFKEDNDTTVIADGYPLLNALKEVHLILAQGAHNQFGDLPWTARAEMMASEWILSRPEIREFLQSRIMVPYKEPWMPQVDTMKTMQGWSDVTVTHFRDLGVFGEQILLSVRYGDWIDVNNEDSAKNWARYWRPEIQAYLHAYRAATGVDLTDTVDSTVPAVHLQRRLSLQQRAR